MHSLRSFRLGFAALSCIIVVALFAAACGEPQVPVARSAVTEVVTVTPQPTATPTVTPTPTTTPTPTPTPEVGATPEPTPAPVAQPGLSADTITIAVIADVDTGGIADELFRDARRGVQAWQRAVNNRGGIGGRFVSVELFDSRLFNHRQQLEEVCAGDFFAIVGSQSLGDSEGAQLLGTEACNIADFPGDVYGARRAQSPNTILANPFLNTVRQAGPARWLVEQYPEASQNVGLLYYTQTQLQLQVETERLREMLTGQGMNIAAEIPADLEEDPTERITTRWDELGAESLVWHTDPSRLIELLGALEDQPVFTLCEQICYSQEFLVEGGDLVEGVYTWIPHSPFDSPDIGEFLTYRFWLNELFPGAGWSEISYQSWMAGRLFEEAFNRLLIAEPEAPTRDQLIVAARSVDFFTANDVLPFTNPGAGEATPCFVLMQVIDGRWEQVHPQPPRDKDCDDENLYDLQASATLGVDPVASSSASSDDADLEVVEEPAVDLENPEEIGE